MPRNVTNAIDDLLRRGGKVTSGALATRLGVSRQVAHKRLVEAVAEGRLTPVGEGRGRHYVPALLRFPIRGSAEDRIFVEVESARPDMASLTDVERAIVTYAFGEMVNNALDHSKGNAVVVDLQISDEAVRLTVQDDGIGAFASVRDGYHLASAVEAAAEITKGKVTTMASRHSGEGLFFTSRAVDHFTLTANGLALIVDNSVQDIALREEPTAPGTGVECRLDRPATRTLKSVFDAHTDDFQFTRTRTVVKLFGLGRDFVSRSEARRLLHGLEAFREVVVDFTDVPGIGQGFADEVFRVFAAAHPDTTLIPIQMNEAVSFFVTRAQRAR